MCCAVALFAQSTAQLTGRVSDATGAPIANARVSLANALTGYGHQTATSEGGEFLISNIPFQTYELAIEKPGFQLERRSLSLRSNIPVSLGIELRIAAQ